MDSFNIKVLSEKAMQYLQAAEAVKVDANTDTIHDFRIASRSLLALEPLLRSTGNTAKWRKPAQQWLKALNPLRDLQVMQERLGNQQELGRQLRKSTAAALAKWETLRPQLADKDFRKQLQESVECFGQRCSAHPGYFAVTVLQVWWNTFETVQARFAAIDPQIPATLHRLRVAFKSLRYLANALRSIDVISAEATTGLKYWHDLLGDIQDRHVAATWLADKQAKPAQAQQQEAEAAALQAQFLAERAQFQALLTQLDTMITQHLSTLLVSCKQPVAPP